MTYFIDTEDQRCQVATEILKKQNHKTQPVQNLSKAQKGDIIIFAPNKKFFDNFLETLPENTLLACGNIASSQKEILQAKNITHINVLEDQVFAMKNSLLTAEGILGNILWHTRKSIYELNILILGSGRVGKATASLFSKMGLKFSLSSYDQSNFATDFIFTNKNFYKEEFLENLENFDVIINTVPAKLIKDEYLQKIKTGALFLEIASIETINSALSTHFKYLPCPALPQKFSAISAGKAFFDSFTKLIK